MQHQSMRVSMAFCTMYIAVQYLNMQRERKRHDCGINALASESDCRKIGTAEKQAARLVYGC